MHALGGGALVGVGGGEFSAGRGGAGAGVVQVLLRHGAGALQRLCTAQVGLRQPLGGLRGADALTHGGQLRLGAA